jgi:ATP phosphoribosyltransferase regulatory subunit
MIPEGMRDVLPPETGRLRAVEDLLRVRFAAYGYGEVRTPWLEFAETLESADDDTLSAGYRLHDEQGHELMVRTDMTVPVARMAADRCDDEPLPLRFSYVAPSIRPWAPQRGQDGEFQQAGVELLGLDSAEADAECVTLLCDALAGLGLRDFTVTLGSASFQRALIMSLGLPDEDRRKFKEALGDRNYPLVESIAGNADVEYDVLRSLWRILELSGGEDVLGQARKLARNHVMETAVARLSRICDLVEDAGFGDHLAFDFGLMQDLDYYSGLLFEAYAPGVGLPLASGGRYDGLLARFDWDIPGVGFAVAVDRAADALDEAGVELLAGPAAIPFVGGLEAPARAAELRAAGLLVAALPEAATGVTPPLLLPGRGSSYTLVVADGSELSGGAREIAEALGAG